MAREYTLAEVQVALDRVGGRLHFDQVLPKNPRQHYTAVVDCAGYRFIASGETLDEAFDHVMTRVNAETSRLPCTCTFGHRCPEHS